MRAEPTLGEAVVGVLPYGTIVTLADEEREADGYTWARITADGGVGGWVAASFLVPVAIQAGDELP